MAKKLTQLSPFFGSGGGLRKLNETTRSLIVDKKRYKKA